MSQAPYYQNGEFKGSIEIEPGETCRHPNAEPTDATCRDGCCDYYKCQDCGKRFLVECPD